MHYVHSLILINNLRTISFVQYTQQSFSKIMHAVFIFEAYYGRN
jgi:hypothetical protein